MALLWEEVVDTEVDSMLAGEGRDLDNKASGAAKPWKGDSAGTIEEE